MLRQSCIFAAVFLAFTQSRACAQTPDPAALAAFDETTLRQAGISPDAADLLNVLHRFTRTEADAQEIAALIAQLGSPDFPQREKAMAALIAAGRPALPALRKAHQSDPDPEIRQRAGRCLAEWEAALDPAVPMSVVRRLIHLRAAGTAEGLLHFLPNADWEIQDEIFHGLRQVALQDGQLDPALLTALADKSALRRAAAALTVALLGNDDQRTQVRKLFDDSDAEVRLRAAQGLLAAHDPASLPVLIALLNEKNVEISWSAEELLHWVAGETTPKQVVGASSNEERQTAVTAWSAWYKEDAKSIRWEQLDQAPRRPGLYLACSETSVWLGGCDGKRWTLADKLIANDAMLMPNNEVLLAPFVGDKQLIKQTLGGQRLWTWWAQPNDIHYQMCQRLPNGHVFLASRKVFAELNTEGEKLATIPLAEDVDSIIDAWRLRSGQVMCRHNGGVSTVDGSAGTLLTTGVKAGQLNDLFSFAVFPDGRCTIAECQSNTLVKTDANGKRGLALPVYRPYRLTAYRDGTYLVSVAEDSRFLLELDPAGHTVWEVPTDDRVVRLRVVLDRVRIGFDNPRPPDFNLHTVANRLRGLSDPDPRVRRWAATLLGQLRPTDRPSLRALCAALNDDDTIVRTQASNSLSAIGEPAVHALMRALRTGTDRTRRGAVLALKQMGPAAHPALQELLAFVTRELQYTELSRIAETASNIRLRGKFAHFTLGAAASPECNDDYILIHALETLGSFGSETKAATPMLLAILKDTKQSMPLRSAAIRVLYKLSPPTRSAIELYGEMLREPNVSSELAKALGDGLESAGKNGLTELTRAVNEGNINARFFALGGLASLGKEAVAALPTVEKARKDPEQVVRDFANVVHQSIARDFLNDFPPMRLLSGNSK